MLDIICIGSLALSTSINNCPQLTDLTSVKTLEISQVATLNSIPPNIYVAKGRPYKSRYREEADRYREDHDINHEDINGAEVRDGRIYRDADNYRRESYDRDGRNRDSRYYQNNDYNRQESEFERNRDRRYHRGERYRDRYIRRSSY